MVRAGARTQPAQLRAQPAQGLVRQRRGHRGARSATRSSSGSSGPQPLAAADAGLRLLAGLPGPRPARRAAQPLRGHRAVQAQGVARAARWSSTSATPTTSSKGRPYLDGLRYFIVSDRGRQAGRAPGRAGGRVASPGDTTRSIAGAAEGGPWRETAPGTWAGRSERLRRTGRLVRNRARPSRDLRRAGGAEPRQLLLTSDPSARV